MCLNHRHACGLKLEGPPKSRDPRSSGHDFILFRSLQVKASQAQSPTSKLRFFKPTLLSLSLLSLGRGERPRRWTRAVVVQRAGAADARCERQQAARPWCVCWCVWLVWLLCVCVVTRLIKPAAVVLPAAISPGDGAGGGGFGSAGAGAGGVGGWAQGLCLRTGPGPSFTGAAGAGGH